MKIDVQPLEDHQVTITAEVEADQMNEYVHRAARSISRRTKIPGFRPGKAPFEMVKRFVGEEALQQQAVEEMIDEIYPKVLEESKVTPGGMGSLKEISSINPPKFVFVVPLEPTVELGDYKSVRQDYKLEPVDDKEVTEFIERIQRNSATAQPAEGPSKSGDLVYVKFSGKLKKPTEGEDGVVFPERPAQFLLADDVVQNKNWPFPGFLDKLVGKSEGDKLTFKHKYAKDDPDSSLAGKDVEFDVEVQSVKSLTLPELNDEFAQSMGQFQTVADLTNAVRSQLESSRKEEADRVFYDEVIKKIAAGATVKYPPQMLNEEVDHMMEHLKGDLARQGLEMDAYFKIVKKEKDAYIDEEVKPIARERIINSLIMDELARKEEVKLSESDYQQAITDAASALQSIPQGKKNKGRLDKTQMNNLTMNVINQKYNQLVMDRLKSIATGEMASESEKVAEPAKKPSKKVAKKAETQIEETAAVETETAAKPKAKRTTKKSAEAKGEE